MPQQSLKTFITEASPWEIKMVPAALYFHVSSSVFLSQISPKCLQVQEFSFLFLPLKYFDVCLRFLCVEARTAFRCAVLHCIMTIKLNFVISNDVPYDSTVGDAKPPKVLGVYSAFFPSLTKTSLNCLFV